MKLLDRLQKKRDELDNSHGLFRNENGAIDLASIMVGIIVIGLIGGVIATTVFAVIPWTQDNAAKQQLDSLVSAQQAYRGLASSVPPNLPEGHEANSYGSSLELEEASLLVQDGKYCTVPTDEGAGFSAFTRSGSGKIWLATDKKTEPEIFTGTLPTDCSFLNENVSADDLDGDGTPNAEDRDADGDGIQDGYVEGGPIATLEGTSHSTSGTYYSTRLTEGGTTLVSNASSISVSQTRKIAMHFIVTCVKEDGSFYKKNFLNGYTASYYSTNNVNFNSKPCVDNDRIDEYIVKPVTKEAMTSGEIENPEFFTGWTFVHHNAPGGFHWSEPDGYPTSAAFHSTLLHSGGSTLNMLFSPDYVSVTRNISAQYELTCERADKSTYKVKRIATFNNRYYDNDVKTVSVSSCDTDRIIAYTVAPVTSLGAVENREDFTTGYTITGTKSWKEADGYPTSGAFHSTRLHNGGSTLNMSFSPAYVSSTRNISAHFELTCEKADTNTYKVSRIATFTNSYYSNDVKTISTSDCGTDRIIAYSVKPVTDLSAVTNRENFTNGYTITGTKSWKEADGYPTSAAFHSTRLHNGGSTLNISFSPDYVSSTRDISAHYELTCERADKSTYKVSRIATFNNSYYNNDVKTVSVNSCSTDRITAYSVNPVIDLGAVQNREDFIMGYTITGTKSWTEADGYPTSAAFRSASVVNGSTLTMTFSPDYVSSSRNISTQYELTCERADKSIYKVNRIATFANSYYDNDVKTVSVTSCGTDRITAYTVGAVSVLGVTQNREDFTMGYTIRGSKSWTES